VRLKAENKILLSNGKRTKNRDTNKPPTIRRNSEEIFIIISTKSTIIIKIRMKSNERAFSFRVGFFSVGYYCW